MHASYSHRFVVPRSSIARGLRAGLWAAALVGTLGSCSPEDLVGEGELPSNVSDPGATESPQGALTAYHGALISFRSAFAGSDGFVPLAAFVQLSGLLADELETFGPPLFSTADTPIDRRVLPELANVDESLESRTYVLLHTARGDTRESARLLRQFAPNQSSALAAHLQALEAYADVFLADLYCSGIPLSTVDEGGYTLQPGSSTSGVYEQAVALFDSAFTAAADSVRVLNLARVGKGRALLALGNYAGAAQAVAAVPEGFEYRVEYDATQVQPTGGAVIPIRQDANFMWQFTGGGLPFPFTFFPTMSDGETGGNGMPYRSSGDPRTTPATYASSPFGVPQFLPAKYAPDGASPIVLADWREARLIEAEAALQGGDASAWLATLNHLRQAGITPALPDLVDPVSPDARVDLLFRERAFWLYLTGHRQGDMRRLIRQYGRDPSSVYPIGVHPRGGAYGNDVTMPVPATERTYNPLYTGCQNRGA